MAEDDELSFYSNFSSESAPLVLPPPLRSRQRSSAADAMDDEESFFQSFSPKTAAELKRRTSKRNAGSIIERMGDRAAVADRGEMLVKPNAFGKTVVARIRPFTPEESRERRILAVTPGHRLTIVNPHVCQEDPDRVASLLSASTSNETAKVFQFSRCLWSFDSEESSPEKMYMDQTGVYEAVGKEMVEYAVKVLLSNGSFSRYALTFNIYREYPFVASHMDTQAQVRRIPCLEAVLLTSMAKWSPPRESQ